MLFPKNCFSDVFTHSLSMLKKHLHNTLYILSSFCTAFWFKPPEWETFLLLSSYEFLSFFSTDAVNCLLYQNCWQFFNRIFHKLSLTQEIGVWKGRAFLFARFGLFCFFFLNILSHATKIHLRDLKVLSESLCSVPLRQSLALCEQQLLIIGYIRKHQS